MRGAAPRRPGASARSLAGSPRLRIRSGADRQGSLSRSARQIPETLNAKGRSLAKRSAGPKIAQLVGMHKVAIVLTVLAVAPGCGSESLGPPAGLGGRGGGGTGAGATSGSTGGGAPDGSTDTGTSGLNGPCKVSSDCQLGTTCAPPGFPGFCGICFTPAQTCLSDADCTGINAGAGAASPRPAICDPDPIKCTCDGAKTCQGGCLGDSDCAIGLSCGSDHHCAPTACTAVSDACPIDFTCASDGYCARKSCTSDDECSNACVLGACYSAPGYCAEDVL
jgi:hypothetical protein